MANDGTATAADVMLEIVLGRDMRLLGPPSFERGSGCAGTARLECSLDFLEPRMATPIRFAVQVRRPGLQRLTATATSSQLDSHPGDNSASRTMLVGPYA